MNNRLNIGLFGFGCVGSGLYEVLNQSNLLNASINKIVVKDSTKSRSLPANSFSYNKADILDDPEINLIVELIDDAEAAYEIVTQAIRNGKHVVTANKKLIAEHLEELIQLKEQHNVSLLYEAAVCGSIPIIRNLEEYYNNDSLDSIEGICNGTTNYILTRLDLEGGSFEEILKDAQQIGFAESDPTLDIDGFDSKFKLQILILHAFGLICKPEDILNLGIRNIKADDVRLAKEKGCKIKLISSAYKIGKEVRAFVAPQFIQEESFAFRIENEFNAISTQGLFADTQVFTGKGAGSFPTASAVLSDVSALVYDYNYEYRKFKQNQVRLSEDYSIRLFVSANNSQNLDKIEFQRIEEEFVSTDYSYRIGEIELSQLSHELYRENPNLFISFFGEELKEGQGLDSGATKLATVLK